MLELKAKAIFTRFITFMSRKIILAKQNYEIYNQKLLIIVQAFKI